MTRERTVLLIGGPDAGKTNYLFRFWLAIRDGRPREVMADGLPADAEYLNSGADTLLGGAFAKRTPEGTGEVCEIPISANAISASLIVPDQPGEEWERIYVDRRWPAEWGELIGQGTSCLIFVRAHSPANRAPLDWIAVQEAYGKNGANMDHARDCRHEGAPTQVLLIEWVQMLAALFTCSVGRCKRPRIGFVVAAWDLLSPDDQEGGPMAYLQREFKMLGDFINSNSLRFDFEAFGVSLFGGDLKNEPGFRDKFLDEGDPRERGYVIVGTAPDRLGDLTLPVAWALKSSSQ